MSTSVLEPALGRSNDSASRRELGSKSVLVVGMGGLGCPASLGLAAAGVGRLVLCDDDRVEFANLHRQLLYRDSDVGSDKLDVARRELGERFPGVNVELVRSRFLPDNARRLAASVDLVLEGADNFATKFLAADACALEGRPVVHGAAIRWRATALAVSSGGKPCYRCLFEDVPAADAAQTCDEAGVMGPVVGLCGALLADLALRVLAGSTSAFGRVTSYDGKRDRLREVELVARADCPLCGERPSIADTDESRYLSAGCAA
jgi:molybdopterin/thiamine biosynthesis adenylyltransferase